MKRHVVILGGGISGMSVAWGLVGGDYKVTILEKEPCVGGMCGSYIKDGFVFDYGPHAFYTKDPEVYHTVKSLLGDELLDFGEMYGSIEIVFRGQTYDYPLSISSLLRNMKPSDLARAGFDYIAATLKRELLRPRDETFEDWVTSNYGKKLYQMFFGPFTEKTWGFSPRELAASFASERIPKLGVWQLARSLWGKGALKHSEKNHMPSGDFDPTHSYYPRKGFWQIGDSIRKEIESQGGEIRLEASLKSLAVEKGRVRSVDLEEGNEISETCPDVVVSTIPIPELTKLLVPLDDETRAAGLGMRYRNLALLFLEVDRPRVFNARLVYFHDPDVIFQRASEIEFLSAQTVPDGGKTGVILEVTERKGLSDSEIYGKSVEALERMGFLREKEIRNSYVVRQEYSYPIYDVGYRERLQTYLGGISRIENLVSCGRQGLFRYIDSDQCIKMGRMVAKHIVEGTSVGEMEAIVSNWSVDHSKA
jgi:protoporphyrinogen oxidase